MLSYYTYVLQLFPFHAVFSNLQLNNGCTVKMLMIKKVLPTYRTYVFLEMLVIWYVHVAAFTIQTLLEDFYTKTYTSLSVYLECYKKKCDFYFAWNNIVLKSVNTM